MYSIKYFSIFLLGLLLFNNALGEIKSEEWLRGKIQELRIGARRANCQQYIAHGYKFEHMYDIAGAGLNNVVAKKENGKLKEFETHIAIKGERDGIILLSPVAWPGGSNLVFEIVIGLESNTHSTIRTRPNSGAYAVKVPTPGILSPTQYKEIYIKISNDVLSVGVEGEAPFLTYSNAQMKDIKYFDVTTYGSAYAKFLYDCPPPIED